MLPRISILLTAAFALFVMASGAAGEPPAGKGKPGGPPPGAPSFDDPLTTYDTARWRKADGWANGPPFNAGWAADAITFGAAGMAITLSDTPTSGEPYRSGELRTIDFYGYGCYEVGLRPVAASGVVTSFFTFAGPFDTPTGGNGRHNEIDIEFVGGDATRVQVNFWTNDDAYANGHEHIVDLGFDATAAFHDYAFKWTSGAITWYVDGTEVHQVVDSPGDPTPKIGDTTHKIMMNLWPVDETTSSWAGEFAYPGAPLVAAYDRVRFTAGEDCVVGDDAPPPPPPPPPSGAMHVDTIDMALAGRNRQAVASVRVVDNNGSPVADAAVVGQWSGLVSDGDGNRTTDTSGVAVFYSRRSQADSGTFTFCVTDIAKPGGVYEPLADLETCDSVTK